MLDRHRKKIWDLVEVARHPEHNQPAFDWYDIFLSVLVVVNVAAVVVETVQEIATAYAEVFKALEIFSVTVFTAEYLVRLWACSADPRYQDGWKGRFRYATSFLSVVDLLAILPFFLGTWFSADMRVLWALRLLRLLRVLKLGRYSTALALMGRVLRLKSNDLIATIFALIVLIVLAASVMYHAEFVAQPDKFSSIPASMWWAVATLTTVGYGDIYPITWVGKLAASVIAILGIGLFALPAGILADGFSELRRMEQASSKKCPHCGESIEG
ncbi:MAG: potassium channel family protein [Fibrobacteres bacterium]|jgi:voltage-gated potassium channel|nr:potassium channel family protein [Fibrobacterota bacterium]